MKHQGLHSCTTPLCSSAAPASGGGPYTVSLLFPPHFWRASPLHAVAHSLSEAIIVTYSTIHMVLNKVIFAPDDLNRVQTTKESRDCYRNGALDWETSTAP